MSQDNIPELTDTEKARLAARNSAIASFAEGMVEGTLTEDGLAAIQSQLRQIELDSDRVLNSLHIPEDAGKYRDALVSIMVRIPDRWGRWISCRKGWYPLIIELDARLVELDSEYEVHQVKEKFGTLEYYCHTDKYGVRDEFNRLIQEAGKVSATICEGCGHPGQMHVRAWYYQTLCGECAAAAPERGGHRFEPVEPK
jgi:hypothetical protein